MVMPRFGLLLSVLAVVAALGGNALAQTATSDKAKAQAAQKMKTSEDPSSPEMQQAAAKQADCKKQAKAKNLKGAERRAFVKDCAK
jgi:hypothetical protein